MDNSLKCLKRQAMAVKVWIYRELHLLAVLFCHGLCACDASQQLTSRCLSQVVTAALRAAAAVLDGMLQGALAGP